MNPILIQTITEAAKDIDVSVDKSFYRKLDSYVATHFVDKDDRDQAIIQCYLSDAGLRIAKAEGKKKLEAEDAKAAIYFFHLPISPDDPCIAAGDLVLEKEDERKQGGEELLTSNFRKFIQDADYGHGKNRQ
jgi:hypothetical protein